MRWSKIAIFALALFLSLETVALGVSSPVDPLRKGGKSGPLIVRNASVNAVTGESEVNGDEDGLVDLDASGGADADPPAGAKTCGGGLELIAAERTIEIVDEVVNDTTDSQTKLTKPAAYTVQDITMKCGGRVLGTSRRCIKPGTRACPPRKRQPTINVRSFIRRAVISGDLKLPMPTPQFVPPPIKDAPLVGMPFFYGVTPRQWNLTISRRLTFCSGSGLDIECGELLVTAKPDIAKLDPGRALENPDIKTTCRRATPNVKTLDDATREGRDCAVVFQKSGIYDIRLGLRYNITLELTRWEFETPPTITNTTIPVNVWRTITLNIKQIQPVIIK
jgi:hypothetical protein